MTTSSLKEIENIFLLEAKICPVCKGARSVLNEDGSYSPCRCVYKESFLKYLGELKVYQSLTDSPLLEPLKANQDLVIEFDIAKILYAHIKTALLRRKLLTKSWKIVTPDEVMSRSFSSDDKERRELYNTDLLIITATAFPFYEAAGKQHEYVIKTRKSLGKITWFCTNDLSKMMSRTDLRSMTFDLKAILEGNKKIVVTAANSAKYLKKNKDTQDDGRYLKMGASITEVKKEYLELTSEVSGRILSYR